jgi:hypothetical protein
MVRRQHREVLGLPRPERDGCQLGRITHLCTDSGGRAGAVGRFLGHSDSRVQAYVIWHSAVTTAAMS